MAGASLREIVIATADNHAATDDPVTAVAAPVLSLARGAFGHAVRHIVDFVLPPQCLGCRKRISEHPGLCAECWSQIEFISSPCCDRTGHPFAYDPGPGIVSATALAKPPAWTRARAATVFGEVARELIHALKYRDRLDAARLMGRMMTTAGTALLAEADVIVPVPLYRRRLWQRRFNQSALLGSAISGASGVPVIADGLVRTRATRAQVGLSNRDRRRNVRGAFVVAPGSQQRLAGARVVLIDDVITTGATVGACTQALLDAGAADVDVLAFALVTGPARVDT